MVLHLSLFTIILVCPFISHMIFCPTVMMRIETGTKIPSPQKEAQYSTQHVLIVCVKRFLLVFCCTSSTNPISMHLSLRRNLIAICWLSDKVLCQSRQISMIYLKKTQQACRSSMMWLGPIRNVKSVKWILVIRERFSPDVQQPRQPAMNEAINPIRWVHSRFPSAL